MRRFFLETLLLCSLLSASAFGNSTLISLDPNDGSGDNFGFVTYGGGMFFAGFGGTPIYTTSGYAPGSTLGGSGDIFFSNGFAKIGPISSPVSFNVGTLFLSTITFPTNSKDFRAPVDIQFDVTGTLDTTGEMIDVSGEAQGYIKFTFVNGAYYGQDFTEVPEPGALGLVGTGLLGIFAFNAIRRRHV